MTIKRAMIFVQALGLLALSTQANAQADLTCDDISFSSDVTSRYPDAANGCWDVVEKDGQRFAKMKVELMRTSNNRATFRFMHPDGTNGPTQSITLSPDWRANINGRNYRIRDLSRGQELSIYMPGDRWEAHVARSSAIAVANYEMADIEDSDDMSAAAAAGAGAMAALPATAGPMPLFALFGALSLIGAAGLRWSRRK